MSRYKPFKSSEELKAAIKESGEALRQALISLGKKMRSPKVIPQIDAALEALGKLRAVALGLHGTHL